MFTLWSEVPRVYSSQNLPPIEFACCIKFHFSKKRRRDTSGLCGLNFTEEKQFDIECLIGLSHPEGCSSQKAGTMQNTAKMCLQCNAPRIEVAFAHSSRCPPCSGSCARWSAGYLRVTIPLKFPGWNGWLPGPNKPDFQGHFVENHMY